MPENPEIPFRIAEIWKYRNDWQQAEHWFARAEGFPGASTEIRKAHRRAQIQTICHRTRNAVLNSGIGKRLRTLYRITAANLCGQTLSLIERLQGKKENVLRPSHYLRFLADSLRHCTLNDLEYHKTREIEVVCEALSKSDHRLILDIGTGRNPFVQYLAKQGIDVTCLDGDRKGFTALAALTKSENSCVFTQGDTRTLPFRDNSFDGVTAVCVLEHIPEDGDIAAMREVARVTRKGGTAIVTIEADQDTAERWEEKPFSVGMEYGESERGWMEGFYRSYSPTDIEVRLFDLEFWELVDTGIYDERFPCLSMRGWCDVERHPAIARLLSPWQSLLSVLFYPKLDTAKRDVSPSAIGYLILKRL